MQLDSGSFKDFLKAFGELPEKEKKEALAFAEQECGTLAFIPNPGPQTAAYDSLADELYYGGAGGGGKTRLLCGLPVNQHHDIQLFRRESTQLRGLVKELTKIIGTTQGFNSQLGIWRLGEKTIELAGIKDEADKEKWQGREADYKGFDEICHFTRSQYRFIIGWNRSTREGQRCRSVATGNPPLTAEGLWVIQEWAPWLDRTHPDPAEPGELRWPVRRSDDEGDEAEIFFRTKEEAMQHLEKLRTAPRDYDGNLIPPRSRTFIPAALEDNPDLMRSGYSAVIEAMPKDLREALKGSFQAGLRDQQFQVIPTAWIIAAQERWRADGYQNFQMSAMALDPAGGGRDSEELCWRHHNWYAQLVSHQGKETSESSSGVAAIFANRRHGAPVVIDTGGGYGGPAVIRCEDNKVPFVRFNGATDSTAKAFDSKLPFANKRAESWYRFREALNPDQEGGCLIALPPDPELRADLAAPRIVARALEVRGEILIESKEEIRKRLGRSPGKGDVVVMCWSEGNIAVKRALRSGGAANGQRQTQSNTGYSHMKRRRGR